MNDDKNITTKEGLEELKNELQDRLTNHRQKIADEISRAREQGDLSENAAYTAALESKQFNEARITELENLIKNSVIKKASKDRKAGIGEKVVVIRVRDKKEFEFNLVGENEADPSSHKISIKSPIGSALEGKTIGDEIEIKLPSGTEKYKVTKVN